MSDENPNMETSREEESHDASNTPSSSSRPSQPALIFYPHWNHGTAIETLHAYNKRLFDEAVEMQTKNARQAIIQDSLATPSTSSHPQSLGDGAPNNETVQIVNMMKDQQKTVKQRFDEQLNPRINPPVSIESILLVHSPDIGITHYEVRRNIPAEKCGEITTEVILQIRAQLPRMLSGHPTDPDPSQNMEHDSRNRPHYSGASYDDSSNSQGSSAERYAQSASGAHGPEFEMSGSAGTSDERNIPSRAHQSDAIPPHHSTSGTTPSTSSNEPIPLNTSSFESKVPYTLFPFHVQPISSIPPCPPGCIPFPGLYHDQHNPVTDEIFNEYIIFLEACSPQFFAPPPPPPPVDYLDQNMEQARRQRPHSFGGNCVQPTGSQDLSAESCTQNALGGRESGTSSATRQFLHPTQNNPQSSSAKRDTQKASGGRGRSRGRGRGRGTSNSAKDSNRRQKRSNTLRNDTSHPADPTSSAQFGSHPYDADIEKLNTPPEDRKFDIVYMVDEVKKFIARRQDNETRIIQLIDANPFIFTHQMKTPWSQEEYEKIPPYLKRMYTRLHNWLKCDDEKREKLLALELQDRWKAWKKEVERVKARQRRERKRMTM